MAFTFDPSTPLGKVRALIRDVKADRPVFEDHELEPYLTMEGPETDVLTAAGYTCMALAADKARLTIMHSDGGEKTLAEVSREYRQLAETYFERATSGASFAVVSTPGECPNGA